MRACFIIDDPNLHWPRYGAVDFSQIAQDAAAENYHVCFATIPLDAWYTNTRAASIFASNPQRISLLVHGNNHTYEELNCCRGTAERAVLLHSAIKRIASLEKAAGIHVSRVMAPPHGACSESMLVDLPSFGFEAATISFGSIQKYNKADWTLDLGYRPSEIVGGCPVLPRWSFGKAQPNTVLLAAFLRQALILMGHQEDLRDGLEQIRGVARTINSLGDVTWGNMTDIAQLNFCTWRNCQTVHVLSFSRRIRISIPDGFSAMTIISPLSADASQNWRICSPQGNPLRDIKTGDHVPLAGLPRTFDLEVDARVTSEATRPRAAQFSPWPIARRILTECRDRNPIRRR